MTNHAQEAYGGIMQNIVHRNTPIPMRKSLNFTTAHEGQTSMCFRVFQGERALTKDNQLLGEFEFQGLTPAPQGENTLIEVAVEIDVS